MLYSEVCVALETRLNQKRKVDRFFFVLKLSGSEKLIQNVIRFFNQVTFRLYKSLTCTDQKHNIPLILDFRAVTHFCCTVLQPPRRSVQYMAKRRTRRSFVKLFFLCVCVCVFCFVLFVCLCACMCVCVSVYVCVRA